MRSLAFCAVFGIYPGYFDPKKPVYEPSDVHPSILVSQLWQRHMQAEFDQTGILVPAVVDDSRTVYPVAMGCPPGGEVTVTVNGHTNPKYFEVIYSSDTPNIIANIERYKQAVVRVCELVKSSLQQTTVSIAFYELQDFVYLKSEADNAT